MNLRAETRLFFNADDRSFSDFNYRELLRIYTGMVSAVSDVVFDGMVDEVLNYVT